MNYVLSKIFFDVTTNAMEPLISVVRSATKRRKLFSSEESTLKAVYLAILLAAKNIRQLSIGVKR